MGRSAVDVQRLAGEREVGLAQGLALRRVRVDEGGDVVGLGLPVVDQLRLGDQLTDPAADHVHADHGAVDGLHELDRAGGLEDLAAAFAAQVVGEGLDLAEALLGLRLGETDRGDLGVGVGDPRDTGVVDRGGLEAGQPLGHEDALREADVGQLQGGDQVADGGDGGHVGAQVLVDEHVAALHRDACLLVAQALADRAAAHGDEQQLGLELLAVLQRDLDAVLGVLHAREAAPELEADLATAEGALEELGGGLVLERDQVGEGLDDGDVDAEGLPGAGELAADDAAAQDDRRGRHPVQRQRLLAVDDADAVEVQTREGPGVGAGGQQDVAALVGLPVDRDGGGGDQSALTLHVVDLAALDQALQALVEPGDDAVLVAVDAVHVDAGQRGLDAELLALAGQVGDLAGVQQGLGGDATAVQAGAADLVLLDEDHGHAQFGGAQRGGVATRDTTEDDQVGGGGGRAHEVSSNAGGPSGSQ